MSFLLGHYKYIIAAYTNLICSIQLNVIPNVLHYYQNIEVWATLFRQHTCLAFFIKRCTRIVVTAVVIIGHCSSIRTLSSHSKESGISVFIASVGANQVVAVIIFVR